MSSVIIGNLVSNMSNMQEEIFGGNTTLWEVLNAQGVPELAEQSRQLKIQLDALARTVQDYQSDTNAELVRINTNITNINLQISLITTDLAALRASNTQLQQEVLRLSGEVVEISSSVVALATQVASFQNSIDVLTFRVDSQSSAITALTQRVVDLETKPNPSYIRYGTVYSVIEWPFWQTSWDSYEMTISGTGGYVPMNRSLTAVVNGVSRNVTFGIAFRDIPPSNVGSPAPLMEGLASANWGSGASLIYINERQ